MRGPGVGAIVVFGGGPRAIHHSGPFNDSDPMNSTLARRQLRSHYTSTLHT